MSEIQPLSKNYDPASIEAATYASWLAEGAFSAAPDDRAPDKRYVIMMPLPNVTGALHMGHAMDNVMQDLLIRWHRMAGDNALWMPGTDHAGIATQAVVEKRLKELEGKTRHDLGREGLVERIWAWKDQYQARIIAQQQRMGCGCDWDRHRFTMDAVCARAVRKAFFQMFVDGLIFRGKRLVNWDVFLQTSVSDDEVYHETVQGHFWHLRYPILSPEPGEPTHVVVATTRPETMLGDTAVAVHPDPASVLAAVADPADAADDATTSPARVAALEQLRDMARAGRMVMLPLQNRAIPLICDDWAKPELGSGCVKITPAHDPNDYDVWKRHKDEIGIINILNPDGTLNAEAGAYAGLDRHVARARVVADLDAQGLLAEVEERETDIGHSDRSKTPIEPYLSDQWFIHMADVEGGIVMGRGTPREHRAPGLVQAAMDAVTDGRVSIHPARYTKTYLDWLGEKRDWPISRQLWWGHRIPVWSVRGPWSSLDLAALAPVAAAGGDGFSIRLQRLDHDETHLVRDPGAPLSLSLEAGETVALDVCLLSDDSDLGDRLEALGFERDPDVLDTWFSSALWPFSTLGWPDPETAQINEGQAPVGAVGGNSNALEYFYPGSCLVTGRDIITLWVARMVLSGLYCIGDIPFSDVFIHANILDGSGERMSKSKGNGIDPVDIIEQYGTDAMRYVLADMQTGTQDIRLPVIAVCPRCDHENDLTHTKHGSSIFVRVCNGCGGDFDVLGTMPDLPAGKLLSKRFEVGRSFCTKLWNSVRFALMKLEAIDMKATAPPTADDLSIEDRWILDGLNQAVLAVQTGLEEYNPSVAINAAREFFWSSLCDWYLELVKPRLADPGARSAQVARQVLAYCLDQVLRLLHPFVPFITEHLWERLGELAPVRDLGELAAAPPSKRLIVAAWPESQPALADPELRGAFTDLQALTRAVREVRAGAGISPRQPLTVTIKPAAGRGEALRAHGHVIQHLAGVEALHVDAEAKRPAGSAVKVTAGLEIFVHDVIDDAAELARLDKEHARIMKEIGICEKKLSNPRFVDRAPADVVALQRERVAGYRESLGAIERNRAQLSG